MRKNQTMSMVTKKSDSYEAATFLKFGHKDLKLSLVIFRTQKSDYRNASAICLEL